MAVIAEDLRMAALQGLGVSVPLLPGRLPEEFERVARLKQELWAVRFDLGEP
ncbi:hypothetical protein NU688_13940 [Variovorax sp. ZS18.2.2]|uniref:hypothetical protein n=1 Tax=Variovorax sp. ZS18.2.2 TaxID=2971255 RepID=UPI0021519016|nr:hypothetical protein [Variovorax sp. ZS18.2.2]MCR6477257.1 hypothetical protein [Variovorax sp. ZS18.2.2]